MEDRDESNLPEFINRKLERTARIYVLSTPDEVRAHCLSGDSIRHFTISFGGESFRYNVRKSKKHAAGWQVRANIPLTQKKLLKEGQKRRPIALVGHIAADFSFKRRGKSLPNDDPVIKTFLEFFQLIFVRNVMRHGLSPVRLTPA
jgi:hypothetical protein